MKDSGVEWLGAVPEHWVVGPTKYAFNNLIIAYPPMLEERKLLEISIKKQKSDFQNIIERASQQIDLLKERRTALIPAAVTGIIDVRGWKKEGDIV